MPSKPNAAWRLVLLAFLLGTISAAAGHDDAAARRTMEQFAGFAAASGDGDGGPSSDFHVDSEGLQRQVRS